MKYLFNKILPVSPKIKVFKIEVHHSLSRVGSKCNLNVETLGAVFEMPKIFRFYYTLITGGGRGGGGVVELKKSGDGAMFAKIF